MSDCYIGRCKCGSVVSAVVIDPTPNQDPVKWRREVAKYAAEWIRDGRDVEKMSVEQVRIVLERCKCPKPAKANQEALAL